MSKLLPWYRRGLLFLVIAGVTWFIWRNASELQYNNFSVRWSFIIAAILAAFAFYVVSFFIWRRLAKSFGLKASFILESKAFFISQLGKYVPGKVTLLLLRLDVYREYPKRTITIATFVEMIASMASWCLIAASFFVFLPPEIPNYIRYTGIGMFVILIASLNPKLLKPSANWVLRLFGRECIDEIPSFGIMLRFIAVYIVGGLLQGLVLYFALNSFSSVPFQYYPAITSAYLCAVLIGIAAIFAPGGIGVREGILFLALPMVAPKSAVLASVITTRLVFTFVEVFLGILATIAARTSLHTEQ